MRRWVSLGGWCGPSLMLSKLGVRPSEESLPFDMVRCTFDGIVELTANGFAKGYFPGPLHTRPFVPDPVAIWLLFRGQHTCFTHFDINNDHIIAEFQRRINEWERLLLSPSARNSSEYAQEPAPIRPVTFLRTVIAENPLEELEMLPRFHGVVRERTQGKLPFRTVMVVHDQDAITRPLCRIDDQSGAASSCILWNLKRDRSLAARSGSATAASEGQETPQQHQQQEQRSSLFDECHDGYQTIITTMAKEVRWRSLESSLPTLHEYTISRRQQEQQLFTPYTELSRVEGVPAVRGSCKGFGSTFSGAVGKCIYCGDITGHAVDKTAFDTGRPWSDEECDALLMAYAMHAGDEVAAVEAVALDQRRGANETWERLQVLIGKGGDKAFFAAS